MLYSITRDCLPLMATITCSLCRSKAVVATIEKQLDDGLEWKRHGMTGATICGYCWKDMNEN